MNGFVVCIDSFGDDHMSDTDSLGLLFYLSIKLHSCVCYSPRGVHRIADKLYNARYINILFKNIMSLKALFLQSQIQLCLN